MSLIDDVLPQGSVTGGLATLSLAVAVGIAVGNVRVRGVRLGVAAVLFSALGFAQFGLTIDAKVLEYFRDFGLVLFVYALGLQLGPGFFSSLKAEGLRLNLLAVAVIVLGALTTAGIVHFAHLPKDRAAGLFTGGFSSTPALAAGEETIRQFALKHHQDVKTATDETDLAYSVAYPFGLVGPILLVLIFRALFRVDIKKELAELAESEQTRRPKLDYVDVEILNGAVAGMSLAEQTFLRPRGIRFARLLRGSVQTVPNASTVVTVGDVYRAVGPKGALDELVALVGRKTVMTTADAGGELRRVDLVVTHSKVLGRSLRELDLINRYGVTIARVQRAGVDVPTRASLTLHFGDTVLAIGPVDGIATVEKMIGNSADALNQTQLIPIFLGIWLGVIAGSVPIFIPGLHGSVRIGLAGGPMLVAILLSRMGNIGSVVWYMPAAANQILRDFGMAIFLACVGFQSGDHFFEKLVHGGGLPMVGWGAVVTMLPMLVVGLFARLVMRMNFITLLGLVSGSMTSSPTLLFANEVTESGSPAVAYAAVYPLAMLVPVFCSQLLVTMLMG